MKTEISYYEFRKWFKEHRPDNFSNDGILALWEYLQEYEESTGEQIEFDPIALCCEYSEYEDIKEFWQDYDKDDYPNEESIMNATSYWAFGDSFIIQQF